MGGDEQKRGSGFLQGGEVAEDCVKVISTVDQISHKIKNVNYSNNHNHNVLYLLTIFKCLQLVN